MSPGGLWSWSIGGHPTPPPDLPHCERSHDHNSQSHDYHMITQLVKEVDEEGKTALHLASLHGHTHCLDELLKAGASPNTATLTDKRCVLIA